ncbi:hypothetical protein KL920_004762 [Ogataea angusta]|nr:hypothetical protein KL920_004762 [Ogataea angusta]
MSAGVQSAEHFEAKVLYRPLSLAISRNRDQMSAEIGAANTQTAYEFCHMHRVQIPVNIHHMVNSLIRLQNNYQHLCHDTRSQIWFQPFSALWKRQLPSRQSYYN